MPSPPVPRPAALRAAAALLALGLVVPAAGQVVIRDDEHLDFDRPEAWAMKYFTSTSLLGGFGVPEERRPGSVELGVGVAWIPELDDDESRVGFLGTKVEDVNKAPLTARLRATVGLPGSFSATVGYTPRVEVFDGVEAHLVAAALGRPLLTAERWRLGARIYGQWGVVESDITCPGDVAGIADPELNPFACEEASSDEMTMNYLGLELSAAHDTGRAWAPYAALAANHLDMEFQVDARYRGLVDRSRLTADGWTWSANAGVGYRHPTGARFAVEVFYTPLDVDRSGDGKTRNDPLLNARAMVSYRLR